MSSRQSDSPDRDQRARDERALRHDLLLLTIDAARERSSTRAGASRPDRHVAVPPATDAPGRDGPHG